MRQTAALQLRIHGSARGEVEIQAAIFNTKPLSTRHGRLHWRPKGCIGRPTDTFDSQKPHSPPKYVSRPALCHPAALRQCVQPSV